MGLCNAKPETAAGHTQPLTQRALRSTGASRTEPRAIDFSSADSSKWSFGEINYDGSYSYHIVPNFEKVEGSVAAGLEALKANPSVYDGLYYQSNVTSWPESQQSYTLVRRTGSGFTVRGQNGDGFTWVEAKYMALAPDVSVTPDAFTDSMSFHGESLGEPVCPGRGSGCADVPSLKIIGEVDPSDIAQGSVGDCWLLSAISALAEFDGTMARLFRKTPELGSMPHDGENRYIVTLWDLGSWSEVDIEIDERLCSRPDNKGLFGCTPSVDGELWVPYLEKAIAAHCGGWDKIDGGSCTHAFRLLTGSKLQYTFRDNGEGFLCMGALNPNSNTWEDLANSPHEGFRGLWPMPWPEVGGGGDRQLTLSPSDMFKRMAAWEQANFVMCCGTKSGSDTNDTDGIVDGHAYTILDVVANAGGTEFNMVKVRNPWGKGEFKSGKWDDDGPGWEEYPDVKDALKPVQANDGVFWVEMDEFFQYFHSIYLCAHDMRTMVTPDEEGELGSGSVTVLCG